MLPVTVAFASDDGYAPYLLVAVSSLLHHLSRERSCRIVIMDSGISGYYKDRLHEVVSLNHPRATLQFLPVAQLDAKLNEFFERRGRKGRVTKWSYTTYYRLFLSDLLPDCRRLFYLDVDILVCDDLSKIFDVDMEDKSVATVQDVCLCHDKESEPIRQRLLRCGHDMSRYFNAGILLINLDKWRQTSDFLKRVEEVFCQLPDMVFPDQDILNYMFRDDMISLEKKWNFLTPQMEHDDFSPEALRYRDDIVQQKNFGIIHYAGIKPWKDAVLCPLSSEWWREARRTGVEGDIIRRETQLIRHYLIARQESSRASSVWLQKIVIRLKLLFAGKNSRQKLLQRLDRLENKQKKAKAGKKRQLK